MFGSLWPRASEARSEGDLASAVPADASSAAQVNGVVGMSTAVADRASIRFASSFYLALASACSVEDAFEQARADVELGEMGQDAVPNLLAKRCDPAGVFLVREG